MRRFSVKQINMFGARLRKEGQIGGCPRSWGFRYLDGVKPEYLAENLVFGIKFHHVTASIVTTGRMPEPVTLQPGVVLTAADCAPDGIFGKMARAAIIHMPRSKVEEIGETFRNWVVEAQWLFEWTTTEGLTVEIDLRPDLMCSDLPLVDLIDWKSTSDKRYALKDILDDVQANVYSVGLLRRFSRENLFARWVYVEKRAPHKSWPVDGMFTLAKSEAWCHENIDATIELLHTFKDAELAAMDLPADPRACEGVGRFCDAAGHCLGPCGPRESRMIQLDEITRYKENKR